MDIHKKGCECMDFSFRLRYIREFRGLTQKQLGLAMGLSEKAAESTISQYERGDKKPRKKAIEKLALALNVPIPTLEVVSSEMPQGFLMNMLFAEEYYDLEPRKREDRFLVGPNPYIDGGSDAIAKEIECWYETYNLFRDTDWSEEQYIEWKINYPYIKPSTVFEHIKADLIKDGIEIDDNETSLWKYVLLNRNNKKK